MIKINNVRIGIATSPAPNMKVNGDSYIIKEFDNKILLAVIDGLGHGEDAFEASNIAKNFIENHLEDDIKQMVLNLDNHLLHTRGVVIGIAKIDMIKKIFSYCGVGNIDIHIISYPPIYFINQEGIVGSGRLSDTGTNKINVCEKNYEYDSIRLILLHSDGILDKFDVSDHLICNDPQKIAEDILKSFKKKYDDAIIIVAMFD